MTDHRKLTLGDVMTAASAILKNGYTETPVLDAGVIISYVINKDMAFIYSHRDYELSESEHRRIQECIRKRLEGMPVQYITGRQEFMSLEFEIGPEVLIPRADTEILVEHVIEYVNNLSEKESISILDIGTGSGCIAVSLAHYIKNSTVYAVDISEGALAIASKNAQRNNVADKIRFIKHDILNENFASEIPGFDIVVSNPPYIASEKIKDLKTNVKDYEPVQALDGGSDGLMFYRRIINNASQYLNDKGLIAFEIGEDQADSVKKLLEAAGYENISVKKDLSGIERVVSGRLIRSRYV